MAATMRPVFDWFSTGVSVVLIEEVSTPRALAFSSSAFGSVVVVSLLLVVVVLVVVLVVVPPLVEEVCFGADWASLGVGADLVCSGSGAGLFWSCWVWSLFCWVWSLD